MPLDLTGTQNAATVFQKQNRHDRRSKGCPKEPDFEGMQPLCSQILDHRVHAHDEDRGDQHPRHTFEVRGQPYWPANTNCAQHVNSGRASVVRPL
jgi:hypothetical protein